MPDLAGHIALVTGATRGIGRAMALAFARAGARILAVARSRNDLEKLDDDIRTRGGTASLVPLDLASAGGIEQLAATVSARYGKLDILAVNAAMLGELAAFVDIAPSVWQKTVDLNIHATWRLVRAFDPLLKKSAAPRAVFMTSRTGGKQARAFWGAYAVTNAAKEMIAATWAEENRHGNLAVTLIDPGPVHTAMRRAAMPGEDPATLTRPDMLVPLFYRAAAAKGSGLSRLEYVRETRTEKKS